MTLDIRLMGTIEVLRDGTAVGPGPESIKPRTLLALLALQANQVLTKESLLERLWSEPPASARNVVEKYVSLWRKALGRDRLETVGKGYRLRLSPQELDLALYRQRLTEGRALAAAGDHAAAATVLREAFGMWRVWDVRAFAEELLPEAEAQSLVDLHLRGLEEWAESALSSGDDHDVAEPLRVALDRNPYREHLAELLMWAHARRGDHDAAAEVYRLTRRRLTRDLGQEPGDGLKHMHERVLRLDPALHRALPGQRVTNLSPRRQRFTGREEALARVEALLLPDGDSSDGRAVAIAGGVGVGKTALALEFARRHVEDYDLIWVVNAPTCNAIADGLEALAARLGCPLPADRSTGLDRLWARLSHKRRSLLIFDNAGSPADLRDYWPDPRAGTLIVTSLNPDWGRYFPTLELAELSLSETVALLRARGAGGSDEHVEQLARELGGLPLACEQAAAYVRQTGMDLAQYLALFRARHGPLLERGTPEDHRGTIDATWRLAMARLSTSPAAVQLAHLCATLAPEDIPLDLLAADPDALPEPLKCVAGDELCLEDAISELRQYSLVSRTATRLRMHRLVQAVVAGSLPSQEVQAWRSRARRLVVAAAPPAATASASWPTWKDLVPHVVVLAGSVDPGPAVAADFVDLLHRTADYLVARGSFDDAQALLERTMALARGSAPDPTSTSAQLEEARTWMELGDVLRSQRGDPSDAIVAYERALSVFRRQHPDDHPWVARSVAGLTTALTCHHGVSMWQAEELPRAQERFETALAVLRTALGPDDPVVAHAVSGLGQVLQDRGDVEGGVACQEQALATLIAAYGPDHPDVGHVYGKLGFALALLHDFDRARECHEQSLRILAETFGADDVETGWPLSNLGLLYLDAGDVDKAIALQTRAEAIFEAAPGDGVPTRIARWRLARALLRAGRSDEAVLLLEDAATFLAPRLGPGHPDVVAVTADLLTARAVEPELTSP